MAEKAADGPEKLKTAFVISPIGKTDESGADFTQIFLDHIVAPALEEVGGYKPPIRADQVDAPGSITAKVIADIVDSHLCIADLTGRNPNVMYEVAIAHAANKPVILLQQEPGGPPFDFADQRAIHYSIRADHADEAKSRLVKHLNNALHDEGDEKLRATMHPVRNIFRMLRTSEAASDPQRAILEKIDGLTETVAELRQAQLSAEADGRMQQSIRRIAQQLASSHISGLETVDRMGRELLPDRYYRRLLDYLRGPAPDKRMADRLEVLLSKAYGSRSENPAEMNEALKELIELIARLPAR